MQLCRVAASLLAVAVAVCVSDIVNAAGPAGVARAAAPAGAAVSAVVARPAAARAALTPRFAPARVTYWQRRKFERAAYLGREYLPYAGVRDPYLRRRWWAGRWILAGTDDPPWAGQLTALQNQAVPAPAPPPYWGQAELPRASFPASPPPYAPPTFQIIGAPSSRNMQAPVRLTHGVTAPPRTNPEPRIIWLDRRGNVVADNGNVSDPHVRYIK
jgi:hypothetical protein